MLSLKTFFDHALNFFFPRACVVCRHDVPAGHPSSVCASCWEAVPRWGGLICEVCGVPLPDGGARCAACRKPRGFWRCRAAGLNDGTLRECIRAFKYKAHMSLARPLADLLYDGYIDFPEAESIDGIVAVPLHFFRRRWRTFNQSQLLARRLSEKTKVPLLSGAVRRARYTRSQTGLSRQQRRWNMAHAFRVVKPGAIWRKHILLVDDVSTTGATLEACARTLRAAGAKRVSALVVARQVLFKPVPAPSEAFSSQIATF